MSAVQNRLGSLLNDDSRFEWDESKRSIMYADMHNLFYRMFAMNEDAAGTLDAVACSLDRIKNALNPDYALAVLDGEGHLEARRAVYPEYKAHRPQKTEEEQALIDECKQALPDICAALGITLVSADGMEADDFIGVLAARSNKLGLNVAVVSSDKDYRQLCTRPRINVYDAMKRTVYTNGNMQQQTGLTAGQFLDALILRGDASDNIKGVRGVGEKTAEKWLLQYGSLDVIRGVLVRDKHCTYEEAFPPEILSRMSDERKFLYQDEMKYGNPPPLPQDRYTKALVEAVKNGDLNLSDRLIRFDEQAEGVNLRKEDLLPVAFNRTLADQVCKTHHLHRLAERYGIAVAHSYRP